MNRIELYQIGFAKSLWNTWLIGFNPGLKVCHLRMHPAGPKPKVPGKHWSHLRPMTFGLHEHWPPIGSHDALSDPTGSQSQSITTSYRETYRLLSEVIVCTRPHKNHCYTSIVTKALLQLQWKISFSLHHPLFKWFVRSFTHWLQRFI